MGHFLAWWADLGDKQESVAKKNRPSKSERRRKIVEY
jgi:hypothetical protein